MTSINQEKQTIWLCRHVQHGNRIDFVDPSWNGTHPYLSSDGIIQAKETAERLKRENIQHIFVSPFLRTIETAHYIAEALELDIKIEYGASEWMNSEWFENTPTHPTLEVLIKKYPRINLNYTSVAFPYFPETAEESLARSGDAAQSLLNIYSGNILIVGHGHSVLGMANGLIKANENISQGFCSLIKIVHEDGTLALKLNGDNKHLSNPSS
ncbi:MAG: histidine phosphatase family protein [Colwellia sp.]